MGEQGGGGGDRQKRGAPLMRLVFSALSSSLYQVPNLLLFLTLAEWGAQFCYQGLVPFS